MDVLVYYMDVLVYYMDKMSIHVSSLTIEYYVLKKKDIITILFIGISMLAWTNPFSAIVSIYYIAHF